MGAKFGEGSSVRADWLCIRCLRLVGRRKVGDLNRGHFFGTSLYVKPKMQTVKEGKNLKYSRCHISNAPFLNTLHLAAQVSASGQTLQNS